MGVIPGARGPVHHHRVPSRGWQRVAVPSIGRANRAIVISDRDVWAVGDGEALHYDGQQWRQVPVPTPAGQRTTLRDVVARAGNDVWAAGYRAPTSGRGRRPFVVHWDGTAWSLVDAPDEHGQISQLVTDGSRVFGVGYATGSAGAAPYVVQLTDSTWRTLPGPTLPPATRHGALHGGAILPDGALLVVGAISLPQTPSQPFAAVHRH